MWTTGIAPLCSSGIVIDKIVFDQVMPQFELCCIVFTLQLSSLSELVGLIQNSLFVFFFAFANWHCYLLLPFSGLDICLFDCSHSLASDSFVQTKAGYVPLPTLDHGSLYSFHSDVCSNLYIYLEYRASEVSFTVFQQL